MADGDPLVLMVPQAAELVDSLDAVPDYQILKVSEVARLLRTSKPHVYRLLADGELKSCGPSPARIRIPAFAAKNWLRRKAGES